MTEQFEVFCGSCNAKLPYDGFPFYQVVWWRGEGGLRVWSTQTKIVHDCRKRRLVIWRAIQRRFATRLRSVE